MIVHHISYAELNEILYNIYETYAQIQLKT